MIDKKDKSLHAELTGGITKLVARRDRGRKGALRPFQLTNKPSSGIAGAHGPLVDTRNESSTFGKALG